MFIRVLGTIAVDAEGGSPLPITSPRLRLVMAILAANRGTAVSADRIINLIWPEEPPTSAKTSLQVTISQLRSILEPNRKPRSQSQFLRTDGTGYLLDISDDEIDLGILERRTRLAMDSPTESNLRNVRELWDSPILAEFGDCSWARPYIEVAEQQRLTVVARHAALAIENGNEDLAATSVRIELRRRPFEERLAGLLMVSLARQGRQAEALDVYHAIRERLRDQLGLEPTVTLRSLERSILEHEPALFRPGSPFAPGLTSISQTNTRLIGREATIASLLEVVGSGQFVTIVGPAGSGKTSAALEVCRLTTRRRTHVVDLCAITTGNRVAQALADTAGILQEPSVPTLDALASILGMEPTLIVFDNCEHVIDDVRSVVSLLLQSPSISVLATSRSLLGHSAEIAFRLEPLDVPHVDATPQEVFGSAAGRLLLSRGRLEPDPADANMVGDVCRLLDGLPLALELGAYRIRSGGLPNLLRELRADSDVHGPPDRVEGQRSLDAAIRRSFDALSAPSRDVLLALSAFVGPVPIEAIRQVVATLQESDATSQAVTDLVDRSLITTHRKPGSTGRPEYGVLETVRSFARRVMQRTGTTRTWSTDHALAVARVAACSPRAQAEERLTIADLGGEIGAALDHFEREADAGPTHYQLLTNVGSYWYQSGRLREGLDRMRRAAKLYPDADPLWRGITLASAGLMSYSSGEFRQVDELLHEALIVLRGLSMPGLELLEAAQLVARHELDAAEERIVTALASNALGPLQRAIALDVAAYSSWHRSDYDTALERFQQQESAAAAAGDTFLRGRALRGSALMLTYQGTPESGALLCQKSIELIADWKTDRSVAQCMAIRSAIHFAFGDHVQARQDALVAIRRASTRFDSSPMMVAAPVLAAVESEAGRPAIAAQITGWVRGICAATGMHLPAASDQLVVDAEASAGPELSTLRWNKLRERGAAQGLVGLVELYSAMS